MGTQFNIDTEFFEGERVTFWLKARNRQGAPLANAAVAVIKLVVGSDTSFATIHEFDTTPQIQLEDAADARFVVNLAAADLPSLMPGKRYRYDIWSVTADEGQMHQAFGDFILPKALQIT